MIKYSFYQVLRLPNYNLSRTTLSFTLKNWDITVSTAVILTLTPSFTILTRLDGEVLARVTEGWPGTTTGLTVTWTRVKIHASGNLSRPPPQGQHLHTN